MGRSLRWAGPVAIAAVFAGLLAWSFRKWTDVHIDFGNELYIAWRLAEGDLLYRDIAHRHGPLSHFVNALLFRAFGVSLTTLVVANLAVLAAITVMIHAWFRRVCGRATATATALVFLAVFAFSQQVGIANFNYVTPYHHFQTHGVALSLALQLLLLRLARTPAAGPALAAGGLLGLLFLTKAELFVPAAVAAGSALGLLAWRGPLAGRRVARVAGLVAGAALVPPLVAWAALATAMPSRTALTGVLGNWAHLGAGVLADDFYRAGAGLRAPFTNAARMLAATAGVGALGWAALALDRHWRPAPWAVALAFGMLTALLASAPLAPLWHLLPRSLPLVTLLALVVLLRRLAHSDAPRGDDGLRDEAYSSFGLAVWAVWSLGLLGKMLLAARVSQYGFVLAMPATLLLVALGVGGLSHRARRRGGSGRVAAALALAVIAAFALDALARSHRHYRAKDFAVGRGADAILAEGPAVSPRPRAIAETLRVLEARLGPGETLLVLPEGIMLNYWLRRRNPTPYDLFLPTEIEAFGEDAMRAALAAHPPDVIVLVHRFGREFGVGPFGLDPRNGRALMDWVRAHYRRVARIGAEPFVGEAFGTVVLERRSTSPADAPAASRR